MILLPSSRQRIARVPLLFRAHDCLDETGLFALSYGRKLYAAYSRAGAATMAEQRGRWVRVPQGMPRVGKMWDGAAWVSALLLEPERDNLALHAAALDNAAYTNVGSPVVTANAGLAPDGTMTADVIADTSAAETRGRRQAITVPNDNASYVAWIAVPKELAAVTSFVVLNARLTDGVASIDRYVNLNVFTGAVGVSVAGEAGVLNFGDHWVAWVRVTNDTSGKTSLLVSAYPAGSDSLAAGTAVAGIGTRAMGPLQVEAGLFPTSYMPSGAAVGAREPEICSWTFPLPAAGFTQYTRWLERGTMAVANARYWHLGKSDNTAPRIFARHAASQFFTVQHDNGVTAVEATPNNALAFGDVAEGVTRLGTDGAVTAALTRNAGAEVVSGVSAALTVLPWSTPTLFCLNSTGTGGAAGSAGFTHSCVGPVGMTRDELRDLCEVG
jgi:hypothetical protein